MKTERQKLEKKIEELITKRLREKYGNVCQLCGKKGKAGQFHILPKGGLYVNLKYHPANILWSGWFCCHYPWHRNYYKALDIVLPLLFKKLGTGYESSLQGLSRSLPKMTFSVLQEIYQFWLEIPDDKIQ